MTVNHIVVLMMENRSFDHILGYLYADRNNVSPLGHTFDGLTGNESNPDGKGGTVKVYPIKGTDPYPYFMPGTDPGEGFLNTNAQLFGNINPPLPSGPATNSGFVKNFASALAMQSSQPNRVMAGTQPSQIMGMYTPELLPVLSGLAKGYAVCDQWFSSAPTETFPNRAFVCEATSQGHLTDKACRLFTAPSIFTALAKKGGSWAVYGCNAPPLTRGSVADISQAPESHFGQFADFKSAAANGSLANYVFLEPQWGSSGNSQHPNYDVALGEQYIHDVYYALYGSKVWPQTLFIITYDEHGGCYDHVPPPESAVAPDSSPSEYNFDFKRFGVRVPAVLISPLIAAGTVLQTSTATPFDHTSILATVEARFGLSPLTRRDAAAPNVGAVLTLAKPRTDDPLKGVNPPVSAKTPALPTEPDHLEAALADAATELPVPYGKGYGHQHEIPPFTRGKDAVDYARKRYQAHARSRK